MKQADTSLLSNALNDVMDFGVKPHEIVCTAEERDKMILIMDCKDVD